MKQPPPSGELQIAVDLPPVSQQARPESKAAFRAKLHDVTSKFGFLLGGDVSVSVEWSVSEQIRYETDRAPDVDNILKPLLDTLVGPTGVLIDDNQVQHVSCHWIDSYSGDEKILITIRHSPDEWLRKDGLFFVQIEDGLCIPLSRELPNDFQKMVVNQYKAALSIRSQAMSRGLSYYQTQPIMPIQRVFHRTRLGAFDVIKCEAFDASDAV